MGVFCLLACHGRVNEVTTPDLAEAFARAPPQGRSHILICFRRPSFSQIACPLFRVNSSASQLIILIRMSDVVAHILARSCELSTPTPFNFPRS